MLANKQARGAFGQGRMEAIVQDGLPKGSYEFQYTLSNGKRPDCAVFLPTDDRPLIIDAKFPLEAISALRERAPTSRRKQAAQRLRQDVHQACQRHRRALSVPGETQDLALMFVPSESVYAELHDGFDDLIQKAYRAQVVLVSPSLLMLAIQVMQQIQKDARMREAAHEIRTEVGHLMNDLGRLHERVLNLQKHFGQANEDVPNPDLGRQGRQARRAHRVAGIRRGGSAGAGPHAMPAPLPKSDSRRVIGPSAR